MFDNVRGSGTDIPIKLGSSAQTALLKVHFVMGNASYSFVGRTPARLSEHLIFNIFHLLVERIRPQREGVYGLWGTHLSWFLLERQAHRPRTPRLEAHNCCHDHECCNVGWRS
jgi:hypothetical protein